MRDGLLTVGVHVGSNSQVAKADGSVSLISAKGAEYVPHMGDDDDLTVAEAAEALGTSPQTVRALLRKGELAGRKRDLAPAT